MQWWARVSTAGAAHARMPRRCSCASWRARACMHACTRPTWMTILPSHLPMPSRSGLGIVWPARTVSSSRPANVSAQATRRTRISSCGGGCGGWRRTARCCRGTAAASARADRSQLLQPCWQCTALALALLPLPPARATTHLCPAAQTCLAARAPLDRCCCSPPAPHHDPGGGVRCAVALGETGAEAGGWRCATLRCAPAAARPRLGPAALPLLLRQRAIVPSSPGWAGVGRL